MYAVDHRFTIRRFPDLLAYSSINVEEMVPHRCQTTGGRVHIPVGVLRLQQTTEELVVRSGNVLCEVLSHAHNKLLVAPGGKIIGVDGKNFGEDDSALSVLLDNTTYESLQSSHQEITIRVPPGVGCYPTLNIRVGGQFASAKTPLKYAAPEIMSGDMELVPGQSLKITGVNFGTCGRQL
ncbi:hypothetical protein CYMTET_39113 [Cymbomonas tetramitiformis]|uniref:IPT/TIG domain-containing protein n=1 Tax=Cymbomonas tetramitiformis TaxID=36881 RepID=A0AAE0CC21_9CHLO|nr:hypothetical protein CYMTET_39113 [Cymbomonas tetramitiformis]